MRRNWGLETAGTVLLVAGALAVALPFRRAALAGLAPSSLGWDAAAHALAGLDLFDGLRRLDLGGVAVSLFDQHWWPPLFGVLCLPAYALGGRNVASASLPGLVAFLLTPAAAWLVARRAAKAGAVASAIALVAIALLFLRSPMLVEMSSWIMLETIGGLIALLVWLFFLDRARPASLRVSCALVAALTLLKYHFGFFLLVPFAAALWREEPAPDRARVRAAMRNLVPPVTGLTALLAAVFVHVFRPRWSWLPSVSNITWATLVLFVLRCGLARGAARAAWAALSPRLATFARWTLLPIAIWCLDPANVRAWYRQTFMTPPVAPVGPAAQLSSLAAFLRDDYAGGVAALIVVAAGALAAVTTRAGGDPILRPMLFHAVWPMGLLVLSGYPAEPRFVGSLVPVLFAAAAAGLALLAARASAPLGPVAAVLLVAALAASRVHDEPRWKSALAVRAPYRYTYGAEDAAFVAARAAGVSGDRPIVLTLATEPRVGPTVRLVLRLAHPNLAPRDVEVRTKPGR